MSQVYFSTGYVPKKRIAFQTNQQEETKESIIRDIENGRLKSLNSTSSNNNFYKSGFLFLCGALVMGFFWGVYTLGYKSGKRKYKYKRCKY